MGKIKAKRNKKRRYVSCYVVCQDPKELKQLEKHLIEPLREGFKSGRLVWPEISKAGKGNSKNGTVS